MLKLANSIEPAVMAENIVHLRDAESSLNGRVSDLEATAPKDYSTTETPTGQKWIDGRAIYRKVYTGNFSTSSETFSVILDHITNITPVDIMGFVATTSIYVNLSMFNVTYNPAFGNLMVTSIPAEYSGGRYNVVFDYLKTNAPGRSPEDQEPEPEEKKTTKKKTTK